MRWRPDLVTAAPDDDLTLIEGETLGYAGRLNAAVYRRPETPVFHLRLDDGCRYVGADLSEEANDLSDGVAAAHTWQRLEAELTNRSLIEPAAPWVHTMPPWAGTAHYTVRELTPEEMERAREAFAELGRRMQQRMNEVAGVCRAFGEAVAPAIASLRELHLSIAPHPEPTDPMERALWLRRNRHTGPAERQRTPQRIDPRRNR
jgi:hypothetical protein